MPKPFDRTFRLLDQILVWIFQPICHGCGRLTDSPFCPDCSLERIFPLIQGPLCGRCGDSLTLSMERCGACLALKSHPILAIRSLFWLGELTRGWLHRVKYEGRFELLRLVRQRFEENFHLSVPQGAAIVPVPLHPSRLRERGFNQAEILAEWIRDVSGLSLVDGLKKTRSSLPQSTLSRSQRETNLRRHFIWNSSQTVPRVVLLVDDVLTTGTTLNACARALRRAGCDEVYAWTLFRTQRLGGGAQRTAPQGPGPQVKAIQPIIPQ